MKYQPGFRLSGFLNKNEKAEPVYQEGNKRIFRFSNREVKKF